VRRPIQFTANLQTKSAVPLSYDSRRYLAVHATLLREGVWNQHFVPAAVMGASARSWSGRPVVMGHPKQGAEFISANSPTVLNQLGMGMLWDAKMSGNSLVADAWLDVVKCTALRAGRQILNAVSGGMPVPVSTGYFAGIVDQSGTFGGRPYDTVTASIAPDHLTILLNTPAACTISDGCGLLVENQEIRMSEAECTCKQRLRRPQVLLGQAERECANQCRCGQGPGPLRRPEVLVNRDRHRSDPSAPLRRPQALVNVADKC